MENSFIHSILTSDASVQALVNGRVWPMRAEQAEGWPFVTYQVIDGQPSNTDKGTSGLDYDTYQVSCFAETYRGVNDLSEKVRTALDGYSGTVDGVKIGHCFYEDKNDLFDEDGEKPGRALDFEFHIER
jgi:hypothetical protein